MNNCLNCGKLTKTKFCSHSCAAIYNNAKREPRSEESKQKTHDSLKKYYSQKISHKRICKVCGKEYTYNKGISTKLVCSKECSEYLRIHRREFLTDDTILKLSKSGRKSVYVQGESRRSKNEKYFYELCLKYFTNVSHNETIFNGWDADIIIHDIKFAVLWNGPWHYKKIKSNSSLSQIQNRDMIKVKEIEHFGYIPYIIKDTGKYNPKFVEEEFEKFKKYIAG